MYSNSLNGCGARWARGFMALWAVMALGLGAMASPAAAAPFASVTNESSNNVSVIATAAKTLVATIPVGNAPSWIAFTPDGTRAYVANKSFDMSR